ncbi:hypothetical protein FRB90_005210 [Tulasnella sp. 427]|nr:hypothetical protein FRB90_005210 [Tulasnella sp. 427]
MNEVSPVDKDASEALQAFHGLDATLTAAMLESDDYNELLLRKLWGSWSEQFRVEVISEVQPAVIETLLRSLDNIPTLVSALVASLGADAVKQVLNDLMRKAKAKDSAPLKKSVVEATRTVLKLRGAPIKSNIPLSPSATTPPAIIPSTTSASHSTPNPPTTALISNPPTTVLASSLLVPASYPPPVARRSANQAPAPANHSNPAAATQQHTSKPFPARSPVVSVLQAAEPVLSTSPPDATPSSVTSPSASTLQGALQLNLHLPDLATELSPQPHGPVLNTITVPSSVPAAERTASSEESGHQNIIPEARDRGEAPMSPPRKRRRRRQPTSPTSPKNRADKGQSIVVGGEGQPEGADGGDNDGDDSDSDGEAPMSPPRKRHRRRQPTSPTSPKNRADKGKSIVVGDEGQPEGADGGDNDGDDRDSDGTGGEESSEAVGQTQIVPAHELPFHPHDWTPETNAEKVKLWRAEHAIDLDNKYTAAARTEWMYQARLQGRTPEEYAELTAKEFRKFAALPPAIRRTAGKVFNKSSKYDYEARVFLGLMAYKYVNVTDEEGRVLLAKVPARVEKRLPDLSPSHPRRRIDAKGPDAVRNWWNEVKTWLTTVAGNMRKVLDQRSNAIELFDAPKKTAQYNPAEILGRFRAGVAYNIWGASKAGAAVCDPLIQQAYQEWLDENPGAAEGGRKRGHKALWFSQKIRREQFLLQPPAIQEACHKEAKTPDLPQTEEQKQVATEACIPWIYHILDQAAAVLGMHLSLLMSGKTLSGDVAVITQEFFSDNSECRSFFEENSVGGRAVLDYLSYAAEYHEADPSQIKLYNRSVAEDLEKEKNSRKARSTRTPAPKSGSTDMSNSRFTEPFDPPEKFKARSTRGEQMAEYLGRWYKAAFGGPRINWTNVSRDNKAFIDPERLPKDQHGRPIRLTNPYTMDNDEFETYWVHLYKSTHGQLPDETRFRWNSEVDQFDLPHTKPPANPTVHVAGEQAAKTKLGKRKRPSNKAVAKQKAKKAKKAKKATQKNLDDDDSYSEELLESEDEDLDELLEDLPHSLLRVGQDAEKRTLRPRKSLSPRPQAAEESDAQQESAASSSDEYLTDSEGPDNQVAAVDSEPMEEELSGDEVDRQLGGASDIGDAMQIDAATETGAQEHQVGSTSEGPGFDEHTEGGVHAAQLTSDNPSDSDPALNPTLSTPVVSNPSTTVLEHAETPPRNPLVSDEGWDRLEYGDRSNWEDGLLKNVDHPAERHTEEPQLEKDGMAEDVIAEDALDSPERPLVKIELSGPKSLRPPAESPLWQESVSSLRLWGNKMMGCSATSRELPLSNVASEGCSINIPSALDATVSVMQIWAWFQQPDISVKINPFLDLESITPRHYIRQAIELVLDLTKPLPSAKLLEVNLGLLPAASDAFFTQLELGLVAFMQDLLESQDVVRYGDLELLTPLRLAAFVHSSVFIREPAKNGPITSRIQSMMDRFVLALAAIAVVRYMQAYLGGAVDSWLHKARTSDGGRSSIWLALRVLWSPSVATLSRAVVAGRTDLFVNGWETGLPAQIHSIIRQILVMPAWWLTPLSGIPDAFSFGTKQVLFTSALQHSLLECNWSKLTLLDRASALLLIFSCAIQLSERTDQADSVVTEFTEFLQVMVSKVHESDHEEGPQATLCFHDDATKRHVTRWAAVWAEESTAVVRGEVLLHDDPHPHPPSSPTASNPTASGAQLVKEATSPASVIPTDNGQDQASADPALGSDVEIATLTATGKGQGRKKRVRVGRPLVPDATVGAAIEPKRRLKAAAKRAEAVGLIPTRDTPRRADELRASVKKTPAAGRKKPEALVKKVEAANKASSPVGRKQTLSKAANKQPPVQDPPLTPAQKRAIAMVKKKVGAVASEAKAPITQAPDLPGPTSLTPAQKRAATLAKRKASAQAAEPAVLVASDPLALETQTRAPRRNPTRRSHQTS